MKTRNLLFICSDYPDSGGVETVTGLLADFFIAHGYSVAIMVQKRSTKPLIEKHRHLDQLVEMPGPLNSQLNLSFMDEYIQTHQIGCVFNQGVFSQLYLNASKHPETLFINTLHSGPFWEEQIFVNSKWSSVLASQQRVLQKIKTLLRFFLGFLHPDLTFPNIRSFYRKQIELADWYVVLDKAFKKELEYKLYHGVPQPKIVVIPNPMPLVSTQQVTKQKEVLYVGRLNAEPKRVDRLLRIWASIQEEIPDWTLQIVGDGEEQGNLIKLTEKLKLKNVHFNGFQETTPFYQRASILCLTSSYEGTPMVIPEAQSRGVVPIVFGSVESMYSLIDDGMNGLVIPPFEEQAFADDLLQLIRDEKRLKYLSENALTKVKELDPERIGTMWLKLLEG